MARSIALWLVSILLGGYGLTCFYFAVTYQYWLTGGVGLLALVGCFGLIFQRPWSRFIVYLFSIGLIGYWVFRTQQSIAAGTWPYPDLLRTMISLAPGLLLLLLCVGGSVAVFRHFRAGAPRS